MRRARVRLGYLVEDGSNRLRRWPRDSWDVLDDIEIVQVVDQREIVIAQVFAHHLNAERALRLAIVDALDIATDEFSHRVFIAFEVGTGGDDRRGRKAKTHLRDIRQL